MNKSYAIANLKWFVKYMINCRIWQLLDPFPTVISHVCPELTLKMLALIQNLTRFPWKDQIMNIYDFACWSLLEFFNSVITEPKTP